MEFIGKLSLMWQFIGLFAIGLIAIIVLGNLFVCLMSWQSGQGFLWWRD